MTIPVSRVSSEHSAALPATAIDLLLLHTLMLSSAIFMSKLEIRRELGSEIRIRILQE